MATSDPYKNNEPFLKGGGEMGRMIREKNWSKTPLGDPASWPQSLRTMVSVMLENPFGMYIAWGKEYTQIYNDGYRPILGTEKHPAALGVSTKETYAEIFGIVEPIFTDVMNGKAVSLTDFMLLLNRNGYLENCFFDVSYSPIRIDDGTVGGILTTIVETTNRKRAIEDLKESESRFRIMAENTDILIAMSDENGESTFFNKAWVDLTGKSFKELIKNGWFDLVHQEDQDRFINIYNEAVAKRGHFQVEFRILSLEGDYRWLLAQGPPRFKQDGSFAGYISACTDITDRKIAEQNLKENKEQLEFAIDAADLATFDYNPSTNKLSANYRLKQWFNLLPEDEIDLADALQSIADKDRQRVHNTIKASLNPGSGGAYDIIYTIINSNTKKESIVHAKGKASFNEQNVAYRLNGTLEDVTEEILATRKIEESEQIIRSMVKSSPAGVCVLNSSTLVSEMVNDRFLEITNQTSENIIGNHYWDCFPDARPLYEDTLSEVIRSGIPYFAHEVESLQVKNGKTEKLYSTFVFDPIKNEEGEIIKVTIWALDNTAQMGARKKIAESERNLKLMILQAPVAISILRGTDLVVQIANEKALRLWGRTREEVIGKPKFEAIPELQMQGIPEIISKVFKTGERFSTQELPIRLKRDGVSETVYINFSFEPLFDAQERIDGIMIIGIDMTEQVVARLKVEESEQEIRALVESAPFPIGVFSGKEMRIVLANQSIMDTWGKGNDVIGKLYSDILPELANQQVYKQLDDVYTTGLPFHIKNQKVHLVREGKLRPYFFNYSLTPLFDADGKIFGVMNTAADVTELNEAKQKLETTLEEIKLFKYMADNAADPLILTDRDGNFSYVNKMAIQKWGYSEEQIKQLKIQDIDPLYEIEKFHDLFDKIQQEDIPTFETLHKHKNGLTFPVEISVGSIEFEGEKYMFTIPRDITERKKAEKELLTAFHKIEDSEKRFRDSVEQAPLGIAIFRGPDYVVELANKPFLLLIDSKADKLINYPFFESNPEFEENIKPLFNQVINTGEPFFGNEFPVTLTRMGKKEQGFFNLVYYPLKEETGDISGIMVVATEVTGMVKAKELLEKSENHFRKLVTQSPIGMIILKGDTHVVDTVNKVLMKYIWEKTEKEVLGKPILEIFPELKDQKYTALLDKVKKTGITYSEKEALLYLSGPSGPIKLFIDFEYAPLYDPTGTIYAIMVTANDVTDKVETRKKVEDAEERLRLATEATGISTWDLDLEKQIIIHSRRMAAIFGYPESTVLTHQEMRENIHPDDAHILEAALAEGLKSGMYNYEARIVKPDNSLSWIRTQGKVFFDEHQKPVKMLGTLRDITDEKNHQQSLEESESKFRLLANAIAQQVWLANPDGTLYYFNQTVHNFSGLSSDQLIDFGWMEMVHPEEREENIKVWMESMSTGKEFLFEHRFKRFDGEYRWQLSRALAQKDASGNIQMWVGSSTDIQEIKEQEQQKDLFISIASHELKTPLTSIKGYVQILQSMKSNVNNGFLEKALGIIDRQVNKLTQLIAELLDVSKIKSGGLDFDKEEFEITELIDEVVTEIKHINPQYEIPVDSKEQILVYADRNRIGQVLINFLNNAIKYSPKSMLVKVSCYPSEHGVTISVEDSGIGIEKREQKNIFQRFYRVEGTNETTFPGFGIGLFISSEIIRRHNGKIRLTSEPGEGSVFSFEIPLV